MKAHRSTQPRVQNTSQNRTFKAGTALENLRAEMIDVEALTRAAEAAADALPSPVTERQRLVFGRIQSLATKASQQASASLRFANAQVRSVRRADIPWIEARPSNAFCSWPPPDDLDVPLKFRISITPSAQHGRVHRAVSGAPR